MEKVFQTIAYTLYNFVLKAPGYDDYTGMYQNVPGKYGMTWGFVLMIGVALLAAAIYYFGVASKLKNATATNYLITFGMGALVVLALNAFLLPRITNFYGDVWTRNLLCYSLIDLVYYILFYELWSFVLMPFSKDNGHHLFNVFK